MAETKKALFSTTTGGTVKDSDVMAYKEAGASGDPTRNHLFSVMKTYFQGLLPSRITTTENDISTLEGIVNPIDRSYSLSSGRIAFQELTSVTLSVSGWYTIAESDPVTSEPISSRFTITSALNTRYSTTVVDVSCNGSGFAKTRDNNTIEIASRSSGNAVGGVSGVQSARLAKSDAVSAAGFKIQVLLNVSTSMDILTQISNNLSGRDLKGFFLVEPYLDNTPTLPDDVTAGTFIEAGAEMNYNSVPTTIVPNLSARRTNDDQIRVAVLWPEIPKQGSTLTLTLPSTTFRVYDGQGNNTTVTGAHTISNYTFEEKMVYFYINETGIGLGLNSATLGVMIQGTGCKLSIT